MKKTFRNMMFLVAAVALSAGFAGCKDDEDKTADNGNAAETTFKAIAEQYVNNTVVYTYKQLASNAEQLVLNLEALQQAKTQSNLDNVVGNFLSARQWWERSEAFLFGPATSFGIDPHIDSWPLDQDRFDALMSNANMLEQLDGEDGDIAANGLEATLLGFHGLEYVLFKNGAAKDVSTITDDMLTYAVAVAGDLRNCCYRLAISWAGEDDVPAAYAEKMEEAEWEYTVNGGSYSYGQNMLRAGMSGSTYVSFAHVMQELASGCASIADEVGTMKIGSAYTGDDETYIESPYSQKSIQDFHDNIISIQNAYMGGIEGVNRNEGKSLHNYMKTSNPALDTRVTNAINNALAKIDAMPRPFVNNIHAPQNAQAIQACTDLADAMTALQTYLGSQE